MAWTVLYQVQFKPELSRCVPEVGPARPGLPVPLSNRVTVTGGPLPKQRRAVRTRSDLVPIRSLVLFFYQSFVGMKLTCTIGHQIGDQTIVHFCKILWCQWYHIHYCLWHIFSTNSSESCTIDTVGAYRQDTLAKPLAVLR
eukprot:3135703-Rhodomonas_salina.2